MDPIYKIFAKYGWRDIYYANPFLPNDYPKLDEPNRWHVGVRTGPNNIVCVKPCKTEEEVEKYKSPSGNSINEAIIKSIRLYEKYI
jgi:hypothetical protein